MHRATEPEDLTGEVFLAMVKGIGTFEGDEDAFRSWVFVIAHRRLLDERRRLVRHPVDAAPLDSLERESDDDVEGIALMNVSTGQIRQTLEQLSDDQRDVLLLRIIGGLTIDEIAAAVGKSSGAVKALQRRGLATLTNIVSEQGVPL